MEITYDKIVVLCNLLGLSISNIKSNGITFKFTLINNNEKTQSFNFELANFSYIKCPADKATATTMPNFIRMLFHLFTL